MASFLSFYFLIEKHKMQIKEKDRHVNGMGKSKRGESITHNSTGKTSFFKTTFNAVNTLAGLYSTSLSHGFSNIMQYISLSRFGN